MVFPIGHAACFGDSTESCGKAPIGAILPIMAEHKDGVNIVIPKCVTLEVWYAGTGVRESYLKIASVFLPYIKVTCEVLLLYT